MWRELLIESCSIALRAEQNVVVVLSPITALPLCNSRPLPDDVVSEVVHSKHRVHEELEVVAGGGVAVQIDRAGGLENAAQLDEARSHHLAARANRLFIGARGRLVPVPCVLEGHDLRRRPRAVLLGKEHIVILIALEGRIEIDQIHRLILQVAPQDVEIVAVIECVFHFSSLDVPRPPFYPPLC
jgi:hypothetical protein